MAIDLTYQTKKPVQKEKGEAEWETVQRHFNTDMEEVKNIVPQEEKVAVHIEGETIMIPFRRVLELRVDLDPETVKQVEQANNEE